MWEVFSRSELETIAEFAVRHDLFVFTDEIYEHFVYNGRSHVSLGSLKDVADRTITISGFSKVFSITGWRIGYSASSERWARRIGHMNDLIYVCAPSPLQYGVAMGLSDFTILFMMDFQLNMRISEIASAALSSRLDFVLTCPKGLTTLWRMFRLSLDAIAKKKQWLCWRKPA